MKRREWSLKARRRPASQTIWRDDAFRQHLLEAVPGKTVYSTFDWGIRDGRCTFILGRTDVINVAGGARGRSRKAFPAAVAEVAVVGVARCAQGTGGDGLCGVEGRVRDGR
jgi:propionyl-CoA synthetase